MTLFNYFFSCFGNVPACSKNQRRYLKLLDEGEERIKNFINAEHFTSILYKHHLILKKLNTTGEKMDDRIYDYILPLSSCDENESEPSAYYK